MTYMDKVKKLEPAQISTDRELLAELGMSDAVAAKYLGKSRQALNLKLGSKRSNEAREPYFKLSDVLVLVMAAQNAGHAFDEQAVRQFIEETASRRAGGSHETHQLLTQRLSSVEEVNLSDVGTVAMVLPAFADIRTHLPDFSRDLRRLSQTLATARPKPWIAVLSSSRMQADMAVDWLRLPRERAGWFTHENVDQYPPFVLVFPREGGEPRAYALTERGSLGAANQFRVNALGEYVKFMLPADARERLFTYEDEEEPTDDTEVTHHKQAQG